ncbi:MAG: hypothetical protein QOK07_3269, partial [Gemmatimonadaceae bacterium]|nr:hypothetical protein [Gemmatimonadaceae bacterium]
MKGTELWSEGHYAFDHESLELSAV